MSSLQVQGYTGLTDFTKRGMKEFPVGIGIYRRYLGASISNLRVPCRYRDIPPLIIKLTSYSQSSLQVQGYTVEEFQAVPPLPEFPVGTGIYRKKSQHPRSRRRVPCRYRDITLLVKNYIHMVLNYLPLCEQMVYTPQYFLQGSNDSYL